jgi:hypothetical protein
VTKLLSPVTRCISLLCLIYSRWWRGLYRRTCTCTCGHPVMQSRTIRWTALSFYLFLQVSALQHVTLTGVCLRTLCCGIELDVTQGGSYGIKCKRFIGFQIASFHLNIGQELPQKGSWNSLVLLSEQPAIRLYATSYIYTRTHARAHTHTHAHAHTHTRASRANWILMIQTMKYCRTQRR